MLWKLGLVLVGSYLFLLGIGKTYWAIKSWEVLSTLEQRPTLYPDGPRVHFRAFICVAAIGLALVVLGVWA